MTDAMRGAALALAILTLSAPFAGAAQAQPREQAAPHRGDHLPKDMLTAGPNVDPATARLRRPPAGYGWFQMGKAYVMASLANGLIVEVVEG